MDQPSRSAILPSNVTSADESATTEAHADTYSRMRHSLRSWAMWQVGLGLVNVFATGDPAWGLLLIMVGISSLWFRSAAMFIVYATTMLWAALTNLGGLREHEIGWVGLAVVQLYFTYSLFRQFQVYSTAHRAFVESGVEDRSARAFPIGSAVFGVVGLLGLFVALASVAGHTLEASSAAEMFLGLTMDAAILGVALGMGSVLSGYRPRTLAMVGLASSGLAIAIWLTTILL